VVSSFRSLHFPVYFHNPVPLRFLLSVLITSLFIFPCLLINMSRIIPLKLLKL
jgi:hypothetical protein